MGDPASGVVGMSVALAASLLTVATPTVCSGISADDRGVVALLSPADLESTGSTTVPDNIDTADASIQSAPGTNVQADAADAQNSDIVVTGHLRHPPGDPLAPLNAKSFALTVSMDNAVAGPMALRYKHVVPEPARNGIRNFFANLHEPVVFLNFLLQHKIGKAGETLARFTLNSTAGVGGLFDVAKRKPFRLPQRANSFPDTLGFYGVKPGPFFYIPLLGPTTLRDLAGGFVDRMVLPVGFGTPFNKLSFNASTGLVRGLEHRAEIDDRIRKLRNTPENNYDAAREFYLRRRQREIDLLKGIDTDQSDDAEIDSIN